MRSPALAFWPLTVAFLIKQMKTLISSPHISTTRPVLSILFISGKKKAKTIPECSSNLLGVTDTITLKPGN
ncbi:hypothetical protein DXA95_11430 [Odoribacter sp. OF09-27XD]|nr:hypothetical protein DXA95_11430 [Odoribacter sp. OF09-27XD]